MEKIIKRNYRFEGKENDYSKTLDYRVLGIEKKLFDFVGDFCLEDITQEFIVISGEEEKGRFTKKDFDNENVDLSFKYLCAIVKKLEITEEITKTLKTLEKDSENLVKSRIVILYC